jgi:spore coat polysaccharide biosynthesis protein SpsF
MINIMKPGLESINNIIVIQARMGSSRLPGKVLMPIGNIPMLLFLIRRLENIFLKKDIIIATSIRTENDAIVDLCEKSEVQVFRGDELNVYERYSSICTKYDTDNIIRLTADNPALNPSTVKSCIESHLESHSKYTSTRKIEHHKITRYTPKGNSIDIISKEAFSLANKEDLSDYDKEHVIPVFYRIINDINYFRDNPKGENSQNMSIDTQEDYLRVSELLKNEQT